MSDAPEQPLNGEPPKKNSESRDNYEGRVREELRIISSRHLRFGWARCGGGWRKIARKYSYNE